MGDRSLIFMPYTKLQLEAIIKNRLGDLNVFQDLAIQRAAAKVLHQKEQVHIRHLDFE